MTKAEREVDEIGKRLLAPLRAVPPPDPKVMSDEKSKFLLKAENLRKDLLLNVRNVNPREAVQHPALRRRLFSLSVYKVLGIAVVVLALLAASSLTVYAAQSSLPGEPLYSIKSLGEDIRLTLTISTEAKLNLTMEYANRRLAEIQSLALHGKSLTDQTSARYQQELEDELELASQMNDRQMQLALGQIKAQAEAQGMTLEELIASLPNQASPAIANLQEQFEEQVQLSEIGEKNPQAFRKEIQERAQNRHGPKKGPTSEQDELLPGMASATPLPNGENNGNKNGLKGSTTPPGHGTPGGGSRLPNPTHTPKP